MSTTKTGALLNEIKNRGSMTRKEMVEFLTGYSYNSEIDRGAYSALLYGTRTRTGIIENFLKQRKDGSYSLRTRKVPTGPYTTTRSAPRAPSSTF